jgi:tetratricopeptide (TPR) repeat protein
MIAVLGTATLASASNAPMAAAAGAPAASNKPSANSATELEIRGDILRSQNDLNAARSSYEQALKKDPKNAKVWNKLGVMALRAHDYVSAKNDFLQAIKFDKHFAEAVNNLGVVYYFQKDYLRAASQYRKAIAITDTASFHSNLGALYFDNDDPKQALEQYRIAIQMDPQILERNSSTGVSAHAGSAMERGRYAFLMARLYAKLGDVDHSLDHLKRAVQNGYKPPEDFMTDSDFAAVRQDPRFPVAMSTPVDNVTQ